MIQLYVYNELNNTKKSLIETNRICIWKKQVHEEYGQKTLYSYVCFFYKV